MKSRVPIIVIVSILILALVPVLASAQSKSPLPSPTPPDPTATLAPLPTGVPDLPPGLGGDDFDIVEWLVWIVGPGGGVLAFWLMEKSGLAGWLSRRFGNPEVTRLVALTLSGLVGLAGCGLLAAIEALPDGSAVVITALVAMVVGQITHGRMKLRKKNVQAAHIIE